MHFSIVLSIFIKITIDYWAYSESIYLCIYNSKINNAWCISFQVSLSIISTCINILKIYFPFIICYINNSVGGLKKKICEKKVRSLLKSRVMCVYMPIVKFISLLDYR